MMNKMRFIIIVILFSACSKYDYTIHKPKVLYKPSLAALDKINKSNLGKRYVWAEEGPYCFDCSGLTYFTYGTMGIEIPRVAREQFRVGTPVPKDQLQKGDLVFFDTGRYFTGRVTHVGIYIGNGKFEHASTAKRGVIISSLNNPYYQRRYLGARRIYNFKPKFNQYSFTLKNKANKQDKSKKVGELFQSLTKTKDKQVVKLKENQMIYMSSKGLF